MIGILIPAYGGAERLRICLQSLRRHAPSDCRIFVLDDGTPDDSIANCCRQEKLANLDYVRSDVNRGFVATCNWGWKELAAEGDILLLNSDTEVTAGFLEEMHRVLYLQERHAVVTPRSNNATIFSVPLGAPDISPEASYAIWQSVSPDLPEYTVMPTAVGFCMLIKASILEQFGLFDEIYSPGYDEENDFVCRINRYGYSAVAANRAFVYHYEGASFGLRRKGLQAAHHKILVERYPEYDRKTSHYLGCELDPVEKFAGLRLRHRPAIYYDLFHLPAKHNGSSEFALSLLRELYTQTQDEWELFVGVSQAARYFSDDLYGYRLVDDDSASEMVFDIAFKPAQIFSWGEFRRMHRLSPRVSIVLQDIIAVRSEYLAFPDRKTIFARTVELADQVYTLSDFTRSDFETYFGVTLQSRTIHHGTNAGLTPAECMPGEYVLLVGNEFAHKGVLEAVRCLTEVGPVQVLAGVRPDGELPEHIQWVTSGQLSRGFVRELYAKASVLIFPSHYEGFGLPIIEGLALGKPVVALEHELNREIAGSMRSSGLVLVKSLQELRHVVPALLAARPKEAGALLPQHVRRWSDVAQEYVAGLRELLDRPPNGAKMRARSDLVRVLHSARHH